MLYMSLTTTSKTSCKNAFSINKYISIENLLLYLLVCLKMDNPLDCNVKPEDDILTHQGVLLSSLAFANLLKVGLFSLIMAG